MKTISLGDRNGNWNINIMHDVLCKRTNLRFVRLSRNRSVFPVSPNDVLRFITDNDCVILLFKFTKYNIQQCHCIAVKCGMCYDCDEKDVFKYDASYKYNIMIMLHLYTLWITLFEVN